MTYPTIVAVIPARGGSKRVPRKNIRPLAGLPLLQWTINAALESAIFASIHVSTDDDLIVNCVKPPIQIHRRSVQTNDADCDIQWVKEFEPWRYANAFAILRPTSPFRSGLTIRRAWEQFKHLEVHSMRAVEPVAQHPGKMWWWSQAGDPIRPVCPQRHPDGTPWHSSPTQSLPKCYVQNASLEMAWSYVPRDYDTISGNKIAPFFTDGYEGFDINTEDDWADAEQIVSVMGMTHV